MKNTKLHGVRVKSEWHPLDGPLKYHVFDVDEVDPLCCNPRVSGGWDWRGSVPWNRIPYDLRCSKCEVLMLGEDGNRWGIK